jgi:hypothetical protein
MQITVLTWVIGSFIMIINIYFLITSFVKLLLHSRMSTVSQVFAGIFGFLDMLIYIAAILYLFFRENAKALRFDALIEKKGYMYKSKKGPKPRHTTQP